MFSRLESIFRNNFLPVQETDSQSQLTRNRKEAAKHKRDNHDHETEENHHDSAMFGADSMVVSVASLQNFLSELIQAPRIKHDFGAGIDKPTPTDTQTNSHPPRNNDAEKAAQAYRHMASESNTPPPPEKISGRIDRMLYHLSEAEKSMVSQLLSDLEYLDKNGIRHLNLESEKSFFAGIIDAVAHEKDRLG